MTAISVRGAHKAFGDVEVLRGVDLEVGGGETLVLLGPSGCGKTTMLRCISGLDTLDAGEIRVGDRLLSGPDVHIPAERRNVGLVFQNGALFPHLDVTRNVGFGLERAQRRGGPRIDELLALVGLADLADRNPDELSGGQQQRVALARALAPRPEVVLMDEPFSNLDAVLRERLREEIRELIVASGVTTLFVTHDREEAFVLGDRVAVMSDGAIRQVGTPAEVYRRPVDRWVAAFVGDAQFVAGECAGGRVSTLFGSFDAPAGIADGAVDVLLRPEELTISVPGPGDDGVAAVVRRVDMMGPTTVSTVEVGDRELSVRSLGLPASSIGDAVTVRCDRRRPAVFAAGN